MALSSSTVIFVAILSCVAAEVVNFSSCPNVTENSCQVHQVRIEPCKQAPKACRFKKGIDAKISFDFTPNFSATTAKTAVYYADGLTEPPLAGMNTDACQFTSCPIEPGKQHLLEYTLHIGKKLPRGTYPIKWKVWNEADNTQMCCFLTQIIIRN